MAAASVLEGFEEREHSAEGLSHRVFAIGSGPGVLLMHELPGLTPQCLALARRLAQRVGLRVHVPLLFGEPGASRSGAYLARLCVSREFSLFASGGPSRVTRWLRDLGRSIHAECGGPGIGVVGMCLTGGFVLAALLEPAVLAAVSCQPSLPLVALGASRQRSFGVPPVELDAAMQRVIGGSADLLAMRFTNDRVCPALRFEALKERLGDRVRRIEIDSSPGNPHGIPSDAHSVLTGAYQDEEGHPTREAFDETVGFLRSRLVPAGA